MHHGSNDPQAMNSFPCLRLSHNRKATNVSTVPQEQYNALVQSHAGGGNNTEQLINGQLHLGDMIYGCWAQAGQAALITEVKMQLPAETAQQNRSTQQNINKATQNKPTQTRPNQTELKLKQTRRK